ncbi:MAG: hypothetical protein ACJ798_13510 [Phenylobacterium sp.]
MVVVHSETALRDNHPYYAPAKAGDAEAALTLSEDLLSPDATESLRTIIGTNKAILLPITALETTGFNAIPDAMAQVLGAELGFGVSTGHIVQNNTVGHTRAPAFNRLVTPAAFEGPVVLGAAYVLVDDHVGIGGTLANLKGYVENQGGRVVAMTTLTQSRDAHQIALRPATLAVLREKHGEALEVFWQEQFGHGLDCLTDVEGQILSREPSLAAIQDRLAQAAVEARGRGVQPAVALGG